MIEASGPRIELRRATRRFGSIVAVDALDLVIEPGAILALVGENGAGKSTALKLVAGALEPSDGQVLVDGAPLTPATTQEAIRRGVGLVHQHFMLVERMTALDNLLIGAESARGWLGRLDRDAARTKAGELVRDTGLSVDLDAEVGALSVGEQQRLEILKVLFRGARALLLDEPTAVLSPLEVSELYATLRRLADAGSTVVVVTHRLDEVERYCDRQCVMRHGVKVLEEAVERADPGWVARLTEAIMGGEIPAPAEAPPLPAERVAALSLKDVRVLRDDGTLGLQGVSLEVLAGEVVGVAGVEGNGQRELVRLLAGLDPLAAGELWLGDQRLNDGQLATSLRVRARRERGISVVHEDRHKDELVLPASIADNLVLGDLDAIHDEPATVARRFARFVVQPPDSRRRADELSGGNQQKVVMARALDQHAQVLVVAQPTRGVDIGTARTIQHALADAAREGAAVLLISADLLELRSLAHRIVVLCKGRLVGTFAPDASDQEIGRAMLGTAETDS